MIFCIWGSLIHPQQTFLAWRPFSTVWHLQGKSAFRFKKHGWLLANPVVNKQIQTILFFAFRVVVILQIWERWRLALVSPHCERETQVSALLPIRQDTDSSTCQRVGFEPVGWAQPATIEWPTAPCCSCEVGPHFCWLNTTPEKLKQGFTASSSNASGVEPLLNIISYPYGLVVSCSFTYINISGKLTVYYGKSPFLRDKSTISMAISTKKKPPKSYAPWGVLPELRDIRGRCDCRRRSRCHDHPHTPPVKRAKRPKNGGW